MCWRVSGVHVGPRSASNPGKNGVDASGDLFDDGGGGADSGWGWGWGWGLRSVCGWSCTRGCCMVNMAALALPWWARGREREREGAHRLLDASRSHLACQRTTLARWACCGAGTVLQHPQTTGNRVISLTKARRRRHLAFHPPRAHVKTPTLRVGNMECEGKAAGQACAARSRPSSQALGVRRRGWARRVSRLAPLRPLASLTKSLAWRSAVVHRTTIREPARLARKAREQRERSTRSSRIQPAAPLLLVDCLSPGPERQPIHPRDNNTRGGCPTSPQSP